MVTFYQYFGGMYCLHFQSQRISHAHKQTSGEVGKRLPDYTALHPAKKYSSKLTVLYQSNITYISHKAETELFYIF
jgi:hypothetical protein